MTLQMAYDMLGANPFDKHSKYDFDLLSDHKDIIINATNLKVKVLRSNALQLDISNPEFELMVTGFDENRDLLVRARAIS